MLIDLTLQYYFDSLSIAQQIWNENFYVVNPNGNGIHMHYRASQTMHQYFFDNLVPLITSSGPQRILFFK